VPYFLFQGVHITEDIPEIINEIRTRYPDKTFIISSPLGSKADFIAQVVQCIDEAVPELYTESCIAPDSPQDIERHSMSIIGKLLPASLQPSEQELSVIKRIVHASGDAQIASLVRFSKTAVNDGLKAIANARPIITDVRMAAAGISTRITDVRGCPVICAMDKYGEHTQQHDRSTTRTAAAIRSMGDRLNDAIVVIGNAPTALMALLELIDNNTVRPSLIIGMPVGFVQAKESKYELIKRNIPYITVIGNRGGSAMAAAAVNALLKISAP
jgi:precorrin-8X/cobalt-precorrin-8 methylmutase